MINVIIAATEIKNVAGDNVFFIQTSLIIIVMTSKKVT